MRENFKINKYSYVIILLTFCCFTACAAEVEPLSYPEYETLTFDTSLFEYLGRPAEDVAAALDATGEWEYVYDENGTPNPRPNRLEPVIVDGVEYTYYMRLNSSEAWDISFEHTVTVAGDTEKNAAVQKVYDLLVSELGEPEDLFSGNSVGMGLAEGLRCAVVGKNVLPEQYTEWWILDEDVEMASNPDLDIVLTCHFTVNYEEDSVSIGVHYALYQPSDLYEIARYRESGIAQPPV